MALDWEQGRMIATCEFERALPPEAGYKPGDVLTFAAGFHSYETNITIVPQAQGYTDIMTYTLPKLEFSSATALSVGSLFVSAALIYQSILN